MSTVHPIGENPSLRIAGLVQMLVARQRAVQALLEDRARTLSPSDQIADDLGVWLVTHPDAPVSTHDDYPNWTPGGTR